jgi:hypothetical protein
LLIRARCPPCLPEPHLARLRLAFGLFPPVAAGTKGHGFRDRRIEARREPDALPPGMPRARQVSRGPHSKGTAASRSSSAKSGSARRRRRVITRQDGRQCRCRQCVGVNDRWQPRHRMGPVTHGNAPGARSTSALALILVMRHRVRLLRLTEPRRTSVLELREFARPSATRAALRVSQATVAKPISLIAAKHENRPTQHALDFEVV